MLNLEENITKLEVIEKTATDEIRLNDCYVFLIGEREYKKIANILLVKNRDVAMFIRKFNKLALNSFDNTR